jgi:tryptophan-rich sensory protein
MTTTTFDILRFVSFGLSITMVSFLIKRCGRLSDFGPRDIPFQPPSWVFGIVWPLLFLTTGLAWYVEKERADTYLIAASAFCCSWLISYVCLRYRTVAALILVSTVVTVLACIVVVESTAAKALLVPLALWTSFATYLNAYPLFRASAQGDN